MTGETAAGPDRPAAGPDEPTVGPGEPATDRRRRGRPGYDQKTVLDRAITLFNRQGYDGTSMGDLARELGFSKSAIYHHVPSKHHLLQEALDEALDELTTIVAAATARDDGRPAYERLREVVERSVHVLVAHQPAVTLLLRVRGNSEPELTALRRRRDLDAQLATLVRAAMDEGALRTDLSPELVSRLLFGMVNSLIEWYRPDGEFDADSLSAAIATLAFRGLDA
ncbi:TetR/AcrR family transcriptional regulator [Nocardioides bigeumensis]|jgi:AcrR family transcriptional regulator|uniref:TetR/AcrR family transcriptional regulator n=1 Tax=Nocardioides bigeumensis TaxID=433657 RepID=A0ABN2YDP9_9ACTN